MYLQYIHNYIYSYMYIIYKSITYVYRIHTSMNCRNNAFVYVKASLVEGFVQLRHTFGMGQQLALRRPRGGFSTKYTLQTSTKPCVCLVGKPNFPMMYQPIFWHSNLN